MDPGFINDIVNTYNNFQIAHPHWGSVLSSEFIYLTGDLVSQLVIDKKINFKKLGFTATFAPIYGLCLEGLMETGELVGQYISENAIVKAALGPNLFGNLFNTFFFANNTVGAKNDYNPIAVIQNYAKIFSPNEIRSKGFWNNFKERYISNIPIKEYKESVVYTLGPWNIIQAFNYLLVPKHMRTQVTLAAGLGWSCIITGKSSIGAKKIKQKEQPTP